MGATAQGGEQADGNEETVQAHGDLDARKGDPGCPRRRNAL
jgi:hypothetical protein